MKRLIPIAVLAMVLSGLGSTAFANTLNGSQSLNSGVQQHHMKAQEITHSDAAKHQKIGDISITQDGFVMDNAQLAKAVGEKGGKYFVIIGQQGEQGHKTVEAIMYS
ncbi:DUF1471 domain-containing protein [Acerihabitans sp. TG2]|uniref:DUF1471 domain-containing protein n=1 Tax=Acerihabitans sp. TG2 TaxID=3096008 RepID=UPI002B221F9D|nr:DUF1471 domain-containing protein [Acerihabitans sp. TG2]MEA9389353.1 DUF1471 domain-containing protein [Acerihabitans sp. TG2]